MRVLGHIHTLNDEEVIDRSLTALLHQTRAVDGVLLVDNGSTDGTLERTFQPEVTVLRNSENLGTSGAVAMGIEYALARDYDWLWVLDADSEPHPDALEVLLALNDSLSRETREHVRALASLPIETTTREPYHGIVFTERGFESVIPGPGKRYYECHITFFSGTLFNLVAAREIGLPEVDYVLDGGECEYAYQGLLRGYRTFVHQDSVIEHNIGQPRPKDTVYRFGPLRFAIPVLPPIRLYYLYRNSFYFWFYVYFRRNVLRFARFATWMPKHFVKLLLAGRWHPDLLVCLRGLLDGARKNLRARF